MISSPGNVAEFLQMFKTNV